MARPPSPCLLGSNIAKLGTHIASLLLSWCCRILPQTYTPETVVGLSFRFTLTGTNKCKTFTQFFSPPGITLPGIQYGEFRRTCLCRTPITMPAASPADVLPCPPAAYYESQKDQCCGTSTTPYV